MADDIRKKKVRRLRPAPKTMRERAEQTSTPKTKRKLRIRPQVAGLFGRIARFRFWKPFKVIFRFLFRVLIPPYFRRSFAELRHVTWPSGKQARQLTSAVIMFALVFGVIVAAFDYGLDKLFKQVLLK